MKKELTIPKISINKNTVSTFVGALAGGAIALSVVYAAMPNSSTVKADAGTVASAAKTVASTDDGLGSCTVKTAVKTGATTPVKTASVVTEATHTVEHTTTNTTTNTNTNSGAQATAGVVAVAANVPVLNNSLNGNTVSVPVLSGNNVNVLNNSPVLSNNDVLNTGNVLTNVLNTAGGLTGGLLKI